MLSKIILQKYQLLEGLDVFVLYVNVMTYDADADADVDSDSDGPTDV